MCALCARTLSGSLIHAFMCVCVCVFVSYKIVCPCFSFSLKLKAPLPDSTHLLPAGYTGILVLCDTFHPQFFHSPPCFLLSCLSLVFFPVCLSPDNFPLSMLFMLLPPAVCSFCCFPSCAPYPTPFPFCCIFLSYALLPLS